MFRLVFLKTHPEIAGKRNSREDWDLSLRPPALFSFGLSWLL